jgi:tRNA1(Val) A37 N6-methylase TrmN6
MKITRYKDDNRYDDYTNHPEILEKISFFLKKTENIISVNPFSGDNKLASINNDINSVYNVDYHLDALDFLKELKDKSVDIIIYDPPYSATQMMKYFDDLNIKRKLHHTRTQYWTFLKKEITRIIKTNGHVISIGFNSGGIGKTNGFEIEELIIINNKTNNDIYCVIENKI